MGAGADVQIRRVGLSSAPRLSELCRSWQIRPKLRTGAGIFLAVDGGLLVSIVHQP